MRLGFLGQIEQRLGALEAVFGFDLLSPAALAGAHLSAIAARRPVAEPVRLDEHDVDAGSGKVHGGREAGKPAADDRDIACGGAVERGVGRPLADGVLIPRAAGGDRRLIRHRGSDAYQTLRSRYSRSHGLMTSIKVSNSAFLIAA